MIITKELEMRWNSYNKKNYMNLGYEYTKMNDIFILKIEHLNKNSHTIVEVECDICHKKSKKEYKSYNVCLKNNNFYACSCCRFHKTKITNNEKYGVDNVSFLDEVKKKISNCVTKNSKISLEKRTKTNLKKYGCINPFQNRDVIIDIVEKTKLTKIKNGHMLPDDKLKPFISYKRQVTKLTNRIKKELLKKWDGFDYYDGEYIKNNFIFESRSPNYPTIDHKISTRYGFDNNISPEKISHIDNLCVTKKCINTQKYIKTEEQFNKNKKEDY